MKTLTIPRFLAVGSQDKIRNKAEATSTAAGLEVIRDFNVFNEKTNAVPNVKFEEIEEE